MSHPLLHRGALHAGLALALWGLSPKPAAHAQLTVRTGATLTIADGATVTDEGVRTWVRDGRLDVEPGGALVTERFDVATAGVAEIAGEIESRGGVNVSGELAFPLAGTTPGVDHGQVVAAGAVAVAGTLTVAEAPGFTPPDPSTYDLILGTRSAQTFATENLPGPEYTVIYEAAAVSVTFSNAPVPVTWLGFDAAARGEDVRLDWATAQERGADYFGVERLANGTSDTWAEVGRVDAAGTSATERAYDYLDRDPGSGTHYYRLRQVDTDGSVDYSEVTSVTLGAGTALAVAPNPAPRGTRVTLAVSGFGDSPLTLRLCGSDGREVLRQTHRLTAGQLALPGDLATGIYQIELTGATGARQTARLLVE